MTENPLPVDAARVAALLGFAMLAGSALISISLLPPALPSEPARYALRWGAGLIAMYCLVESASRSQSVIFAFAGYQTPPMHLHPIASRSISEFWSQRWNRVISDYLRIHYFLPWARRRRPSVGLLAAFVASTVLHTYIFGVALADATMTGWIAVFFLAQIPLVHLERRVAMGQRPHAVQRLWTLGILTAMSPLFVEPALRSLGL